MSNSIWKAVSVLFSIPVIAMVIGTLLMETAYGTGLLQMPFLLFLMYYVLVPVVIGVWLYRNGQLRGLELVLWKDRLHPLRVSLAASCVALVTFAVLGVHALFIGFAVAHVITIGLLYRITDRWKISIHGTMMGALLGVTLLLATIESPAVILAVGLVGIARVRLHRHTPKQYLAGVGLGTAVFLTCLTISYLSAPF